MPKQGLYIGPRLRRLRRDLGLTQAGMASDLDISAPYVALMERNQRPVTADMLLRLARTYRLDVTELAGEDGEEHMARLQAVLKDPIFADIDLAPLELADAIGSFPGIGEVLLRLHTAYREEQLRLADLRAEGSPGGSDPVAEVRNFLAARRNFFPALDASAERLAAAVAEAGGMAAYLAGRHRLRVRRLPSDVMYGSLRRLDRHRHEILLDETLSASSQAFQLAQQLAYLELEREIGDALRDGGFSGDGGRRLAHRSLASYAAAAMLMPYEAFARAAESRHYDVDVLARLFSASFEQAAHRLTTLQKPGQERVPFFFIRVDEAGNVSKRLDGAGFPFGRHGGGCPLWSVHQVFRRPGEVVAQWLELPDGQRFFSVARTVSSGGGSFGEPRVERAVALGCAARHADRLVYARQNGADPARATPIGIACGLCQRTACTARSEPPIGRQILPDDYRRTRAPFGFSDN
ncbi:MAG: short-chain fatty acyl-CoA regulator family protein [Rhizobiaceae bacterium]